MDLTDLIAGPIPWASASPSESSFDFRVLFRTAYFSRNFSDEPFCPSETDDQLNARAEKRLTKSRELGATGNISLSDIKDVEFLDLNERFVMPPHLSAGLNRMDNRRSKHLILFAEPERYAWLHFKEHYISAKYFPGIFRRDEDMAAIQNEKDKLDSIPWARDAQFGFLTANPVFAGAGFQLAALVHCPGFSVGGHIENFNNAARAMGVQLLDLGSLTAKGGFFWMISLGGYRQNEEEIYTHSQDRYLEILEAEQKVSTEFYRREKMKIEDKVFRSQALLLSSRRLPFLEFLECQSWIRWGVYLELVPRDIMEWLNILLVRTGPGHILLGEVPVPDMETQNVMRADMVRLTLEEWQNSRKKR